MSLSQKEVFDAEIIKQHFSATHYTEVVNDPPDICLDLGYKQVGVELTEMSPNLYKNRVSVDKSYEGFIKKIDIEIPDFTHYIVMFHHANKKLNRSLKKKIKGYLNSPNTATKWEKCIDGVFVRIKSIPREEKQGKISHISLNLNSCDRNMAFVAESLSDANIQHVFGSMLKKAVETKKEKCKNINQPVWLAMHDSYFSYIFSENKEESIKLYTETMENIDFGIFEKIIIIFKGKEVIFFDKKIT